MFYKIDNARYRNRGEGMFYTGDNSRDGHRGESTIYKGDNVRIIQNFDSSF